MTAPHPAPTPTPTLALPPAERVPAPVRQIVERLRQAGHEAVLVGGCVRDLLRGGAVRDFDVATAARPEAVLALFPRAVPVGLRFGNVMLPAPGLGPVDVTTYRGDRLRQDLAHRDLTVNAMAWDLAGPEPIDPFGGREDLQRGLLRAVGRPAERLAEDPARAVRVARLAAQLGFAVDPALEKALTAARAALARVPRERLRRELESLLVAPHAGRGLELLRRAELEEELAPGTRVDAAAVVDALPASPVLRLAAWLRGADAEACLRRLRFPRALSTRIGRLVRLHPVDLAADPRRPAEIRRLLRRTDASDTSVLATLRRAELDVAGAPAQDPARRRLAALEAAVTRERRRGALALHRRDLALDGRDVMRLLGRGPGPHVGRALDHLTECVLDDPSLNTPARLEDRLRAWAQEDPT